MIYLELFTSFILIGFTSFGGLSMIPLISQQMLDHGWMSAQEVADIVAIAEMTPGPLGINCATFAGTRTAGLPGAAIATLGVMLPSLTLTMVAAFALAKFRENRGLAHAMYGIRPVAIGLIASIVIEQGQANYFTVALVPYLPALLIGMVALFLLLRLHWDVPPTILVCALLGLLAGALSGPLGYGLP